MYNPDGTLLRSGSFSSNSDIKLDLDRVPQTGTYLVYVQPNGPDTGTVDLALWNDATGTVDVDGLATSIALGTGQNGRYTFNGNANDIPGLGVPAFATTPAGGSVNLQVLKPDGTFFGNTNCGSVTAPTSCQLWGLPVTGTYTLRVLPADTRAVTLNVLLSRPLLGTLTANGTATRVQITRAGQTARYTFSGTAGQGMSLRVTAGSTFPSGGFIGVYNPDGTLLRSGSFSSNLDIKLDLDRVPQTGTYLVYVQPNGPDTGPVDLTLWNDATGTVDVDGLATSIALGTGQNGRYTFTGNANDPLGLGVTTFATNPTGGSATFSLLRPDGTALWVGSGGAGSLQLPALPVAGTYTLRVIPSETKAATLTLLLSRPLTGTLTVDGVATRYQTSRAGQTGRYTFAGTAGQGLTLQATTGATFPSSVLVGVFRPDGSWLTGAYLPSNSDSKFDLGILPAAGTYTVWVIPNGLDTGTVDLRLVSEATGTLTVGAPATSIALGTAQNGRYTFTGNANDLLTLGVTTFATSPAGGSASLQLLKPDGTSLWSAGVTAPASWPLPALPTTGTYTLRVIPSETRGATLTVLLSR